MGECTRTITAFSGSFSPARFRCGLAILILKLVSLPTQPRSALAKGVGGGPHFQVDQGLLLEITRETHRHTLHGVKLKTNLTEVWGQIGELPREIML